MSLKFEDFKGDHVLKVISRQPIKVLDDAQECTLETNQKSGISMSDGRLRLFEINQNDRKNIYFTKSPEFIDRFIAFNEYLASTLLQIAGCDTPKNKIIIGDYGNVGQWFLTGSKKLSNIDQFTSSHSIESYVKAITKNSELLQSSGEHLSRLMATVFALGDYDINPSNYYTGHDGIILGKMDHDWSFRSRNAAYQPMDMEKVPHCIFLMELTGNSFAPSDFYDKHTMDYDYFSDEVMDIIKKNPAKTYLLVSFAKNIKNFIEMPEDIKSYIFSNEDFIKNDDFAKCLSESQLEDYFKRYVKKLKNEFDKNIEEMRNFIQKPLEMMSELESILKENGLKVPENRIDYSKAVTAIIEAKRTGKTLHELKKGLKENFIKQYKENLLISFDKGKKNQRFVNVQL